MKAWVDRLLVLLLLICKTTEKVHNVNEGIVIHYNYVLRFEVSVAMKWYIVAFGVYVCTYVLCSTYVRTTYAFIYLFVFCFATLFGSRPYTV